MKSAVLDIMTIQERLDMRTRTVDKQIPLTAGSSKQPVQSTGSNPPNWGVRAGSERQSRNVRCFPLIPCSTNHSSRLCTADNHRLAKSAIDHMNDSAIIAARTDSCKI